MHRRAVLLLALLSGCHRILPLDAPIDTDAASADRFVLPVDTGAADTPGDALLPDARWRDGPAPTCPVDDFTDPTLSGLTQRKGDWIWQGPTEVRQQDLTMRDAHAVLAGFTVPTGKSFTANTNVTITDVNTTATAGGAGLGILVGAPSNWADPFHQVSCLMLRKGNQWYWTVSVCTGTSNVCETRVDTPISFDQLNKKIQLILLADGQGKVTCTYKQGLMPNIATADVSAHLSSTPIGVALITFEADARFDRASACE